jgi:hypothetical protein
MTKVCTVGKFTMCILHKNEVGKVQCTIYLNFIFKTEDLIESRGKVYVEIVDCG